MKVRGGSSDMDEATICKKGMTGKEMMKRKYPEGA